MQARPQKIPLFYYVYRVIYLPKELLIQSFYHSSCNNNFFYKQRSIGSVCFSFNTEQLNMSLYFFQEYLSSKGIVHRDLAARNILIAEGLVAKVADFGLSRNVTYESKLYQASASRRLPIRWMSPEAIDVQIFTSKSDM